MSISFEKPHFVMRYGYWCCTDRTKTIFYGAGETISLAYFNAFVNGLTYIRHYGKGYENAKV